MATKKVKKFGRGGDILTGLGAGLAGYGIYKALTKGKDQDDDYTRRVKEYGTKGRFPEEKTEEKAVPDTKKDKPEDKNAADDKIEAKELSKLGRFPFEAGDGTSGAGLGNKDNTAAINAARAPRNVGVNKKVVAADKKEPAKNRSEEFANLYQGLTKAPPEPADTRLKPADVSGVGSNVLSNVAGRRQGAATRERAAKERLAKFEAKRKETKERETRRTEAQNKAKSGTSLRAPGSKLRAPGSKVDLNDPSSMILGGDLDPKAMMRRNKSRMSGDVDYKKGGAVKKYASGGSVSSASKRADGIAMRGKTRGKVC